MRIFAELIGKDNLSRYKMPSGKEKNSKLIYCYLDNMRPELMRKDNRLNKGDIQ